MPVDNPEVGVAIAAAICSHNATRRFRRGTLPRSLVAIFPRVHSFLISSLPGGFDSSYLLLFPLMTCTTT
jgi:hypothetical protein